MDQITAQVSRVETIAPREREREMEQFLDENTAMSAYEQYNWLHLFHG